MNIILTIAFIIISLSASVLGCVGDYCDITEIAERNQFTVTSDIGGRHKKDSKHYKGLAVDLRTRDKDEAEIRMITFVLESNGYVVLDERKRQPWSKHWTGPHLHVYAPCSEDFDDANISIPVFDVRTQN